MRNKAPLSLIQLDSWDEDCFYKELPKLIWAFSKFSTFGWKDQFSEIYFQWPVQKMISNQACNIKLVDPGLYKKADSTNNCT